MDLNVLIRGQSNAQLFADRGGAAALEKGLESRLGVDVHLLYEFGTDSSTIHSATPFMTWDTEGQQASLLRYVRGLSADLKDNPTATVWMHNEYDQMSDGLTTSAWLGEVRADATLVRDALGQGTGTTPYTFVPIRYPYGGSWQPIGDGMAALDADASFNAEISWAAQSLAMNGGPEAGNNASHMGDADAVKLGGELAASMAATLRPLANGSSPTPTPTPTAPAPAQATVGSGSDTLVLRVSQDPYQGGAQYTVKVDGVQVGGTQTAVAWHSSGQSDTLTVKGDWAGGGHSVAVEFLNDAWGGTAATDRNLYVDGATYNGAAVAGAAASLMSAGPATFNFTDTNTAPPGPQPPATDQPTPTTGNDTIVGTANADTIDGLAGDDNIKGGGGNDTIIGNAGNDTLNGEAGLDIIRGGAGKDIMTGGPEADQFDFDAYSQSPYGQASADQITDFAPGVDDIDLRTIDARSGVSGDQAFVFRGSQGFSGGGVGSVRVVQFTGYTVVEVDNGNGGTAEMQIQLNKVSLTSGDFLL